MSETLSVTGQLDFSHTPDEEMHFAFIAALGSKDNLSPGTTHRSAVETNAFTVDPSSDHLQLEISAHVKLNSWLQVNTVPVPPPSVLESNEIATKDPLLANIALRSIGATID